MRPHGGQIQESSQSFYFCLENVSTAPPMKKTGSVKGEPLLGVREGAVEPILDHVLGAVLSSHHLLSMEEERYQLKTRKNCKGIFFPVISLGKL